MQNLALKLDSHTFETQREFPIFNLLTRILVQSLCPLLKSEIMFGDVETTDTGELYPYWIDANIAGDLSGQIGVGTDPHTLRNLAIKLAIKNEAGAPDPAKALIFVHEILASTLEKHFLEEGFQCELMKGSGLCQDFTFVAPDQPFVICPVETKAGVLKVFISVKPTSSELMEEFSNHAVYFEPRKIRVFASQLDNLFTKIESLEGLEGQLLTGPQVRGRMRLQIKALKRMLQQLKSESLETLFMPSRKLVVEIAKQRGKQIKFNTHGAWLYLDKTLLNHLYEPLLHMVRNAADHGIEEPTERERIGKPATGNIKCLAAFSQEGLRLIVSDDGRGIDFAKLRERAVAKGILTTEEATTKIPSDLLELIFQPGFSTRDEADGISGRGLGLDIVAQGINAVGGKVRILSTTHHGTSFEIIVPLKPDFSTKKVAQWKVESFSREEEEKTLLQDELVGYLEKLNRTVTAFRKEKTAASAFEAFRLVHSVKGATGFLGWTRVSSFCHHFEELLKILSEGKTSITEESIQLVSDAGKRLKEFVDASRTSAHYSLYSIRQLEARMLQALWAATNSEEKTHLFLGKYHVAAAERLLSNVLAGNALTAKPESNLKKALAQPYGTLIQFSGDRRGYAGLLLPEETFAKLICPVVTGKKETKASVKNHIWALSEAGTLMGSQISQAAGRAGIALAPSAPLTYFGWGEPLRILGNPTYCYECDVNGLTFYLAGDFRNLHEVTEVLEEKEPDFQPAVVMKEAMRQCEKHFSHWGLQVKFSEVPTQSDLIGFDGGITVIISCISQQKGSPDCVIFVSYEQLLADHIVKGFSSEVAGGKEQMDLYDCLNETSNLIGGLLISELEKGQTSFKLSLPTVFNGKAYVPNFNRLFVTNKLVGSTQKGRFELQILVTNLGEDS